MLRFLFIRPKMTIGRCRSPFPRSLIIVAAPAAIIERVRMFVGETTVVHEVPTINAATDAVRDTVGSCLVMTVPGDAQLDQVLAYERLRVLFPYVPVIALFVEGVSAHRGAMLLGRGGLTELVSVDGEVDLAGLRVALRRAHASGVSHRIWNECCPRLPEALVTLLKTALRIAHAPISIEALASAAGMPERSLRKFCEDEQIPSPQWIIGWARLLMAAFYLDEPGRTIAQVADVLDFASSCALRNQLRRYTGVSARHVRASGSIALLCRAIEHAANECQRCTPHKRITPSSQ